MNRSESALASSWGRSRTDNWAEPAGASPTRRLFVWEQPLVAERHSVFQFPPPEIRHDSLGIIS